MQATAARNRIIPALLGISCAAWATALPAAPLGLSDVPLTVSTSVPPNIMLMLDSSGSMQNIVPDAPYAPNTTYLASCPAANLVAAATQVETRIVSGAPRIRIGTTNYAFGTGSGQKCFASDTDYMAKLYADGTSGGSTSSYLPAQYTGNYLNWYFSTATDPAGCADAWSSGRKPCTQSRLMIAKNASKNLVDTMSAGMRTGLSSYNSDTGGTLREIIGDLTSAKRTALKSKIDAMSASGSTPLAETLSDIGRYLATGYTGNLTLHPGRTNQSTASVAQVFNNHSFLNSSGQTIVAPIQYWCQKSFAVLLTDGRPQGDQSISTYLADYDGDCVSASPACLTFDRKQGREYESAGSDYLDDVAQALYEMDLRPDLTNPQGVKKNNVTTHLISFADDQAINDPLMRDTATQGGGQFFVAGNEAQLAAAFQAALASILEQSGSSASATANTGFVGTDTKVYQARFNSGDWTGQLLAFAIDGDTTSSSYGLPLNNGAGPEGSLWNAGGLIPSWDSRNIFTWNGGGVRFRWDQLSTAQQTALGTQGMLEYVRGDATQELRNGGTLRNRASKLGDIVNSAPVFVGAPALRYPDNLESAAYSAFKTAQANRSKMVYVGANDGMLHGFNAETGAEVMAYVPSRVFGNLASLSSPAYSHKYFVDGSPTTIDAFINGQWRTVLAGGLNHGGQGIYALDVTNPSNFGESSANATALALWEFTDANDSDLGYTYSQPAIVKLQNGTWAAIFGNGYNNTEADGSASTTGNAVLYIVNLQTGALIKKISTRTGTAQDPTGASRPNGLATVAVVDTNNDFKADAAYAGDLFGNLWKFDLSSGNPNQWGLAFNNNPLFTACGGANCSATNHQPITSRPSVGRNTRVSGVLVYFGTGKYLETTDNNGTAGGMQTFYAIADTDSAQVVSGRSALLQQSITDEFSQTFGANTFGVRVTTTTAIDWTAHKGWYMDLVSPVLGQQGERQVTNSVLRNGKIIFTTTIPGNDPCQAGGDSWLMEMDANSGARLSYSPFDLNDDRKFTEADYVTVTQNGTTKRVPASGMKLEGGGAATPTVTATEDGETKFISSAAGMQAVRENPGPRDVGRQTWRQLGR